MNQISAPMPPKAQIIEVDDDQAGQRVDNFLMARLKGVPRSRVYQMLRKGEVRVNKGRIKASYRLQMGDAVRIPPVRVADTTAPANPGTRVLSLIEKRILAEEKGFLVLNKPSGIAVHGGSGLNYGIIEALRRLRPDAPYLELVHRLDRETSGCLLIAKRRSVLRELHRLLRENGIDKRYLALLKGPWQGGERRVEAPLLKNTLRSGERVVTVSEQGKPAISVFRPLTRFAKATLVEVSLLTGRTHQIRVHAASIGQPIVGDEKYGDAAFNREMKNHGVRRLFLHAHSLRFSLDDAEPAHYFEAPLDDELESVLTSLSGES